MGKIGRSSTRRTKQIGSKNSAIIWKKVKRRKKKVGRRMKSGPNTSKNMNKVGGGHMRKASKNMSKDSVSIWKKVKRRKRIGQNMYQRCMKIGRNSTRRTKQIGS